MAGESVKVRRRWIVPILALMHVGAADAIGEEAQGAALFKSEHCADCHKDTSSRIAPTLVGLYTSRVLLSDGTTVTADETYIRESIKSPKAKIVSGYKGIMPVVQLTDDQIDALVAYIKTLK